MIDINEKIMPLKKRKERKNTLMKNRKNHLSKNRKEERVLEKKRFLNQI